MIKGSNVKRSIFNTGMLISIFVQLIYFIYILSINSYIPNCSDDDVLTSITSLFGMSGFIYFAPLFPGLPFAFSYIDEKNSGYIYYMIGRMGKKKYMIRKLLWTGLSGGTASSFPVFLVFFYLTLTLHASAGDAGSEYFPYMFEGMNWEAYIGIWGGRFVLLLKLILIFLFGVFWSEVTLMLSLIISNKYIVLILPTAIYLTFWMIGIPEPLYNLQWIILYRGDYWSSFPVWFGHAVQTVNICIILILTYLLLRRCLKDE